MKRIFCETDKYPAYLFLYNVILITRASPRALSQYVTGTIVLPKLTGSQSDLEAGSK